MDDSTIRKLNLMEVLEEEVAAAGRAPKPLPEDAPSTWSEDAIRAFFQPTESGQPCQPGTIGLQVHAGPKTQAAAHVAPFAEPDAEEFTRWFPAYHKFATTLENRPKLRLVCLPCAGSAEDTYTSEGTGVRRVASPLLEWCRSNCTEVLAAQPPGRGMRIREPFCGSAQELAETLLPLLGSKLQDGTPYVVISHSMGCWIAFELLQQVRQVGLPMPVMWFLGAMPCPTIPDKERPWRLQHELNDKEFQEECRGWDINDAVFQMWSIFEPLLRADFHIFDSYHLRGACPAPFADLPLHTFWGTKDKRIKMEMVQAWRAFTTGPFTCTAIDGNHLWPLSKEPKLCWLQHITDRLSSMQI